MGIAGAASAVGLAGLAFYAYHKFGTDPAILVDASTIRQISEHGGIQVQTALSGLGQIQMFISDVVQSHGAQATMGDVFDKLQASGIDPQVFKDAVTDQAQAMGGSDNALWAEKLVDPQTPLSTTAQYKITEAVWYHDKQVALNQATLADATVFVKTGISVALASLTSVAATNMDAIKGLAGHMLSCAKRVAVDCGLIADSAERQVRQMIKESYFDPAEARARLACEYAERQTPMYRSFTLSWLQAVKEQDRAAMLHLFGMEPVSLGKHSTLGQAVMIDQFSAAELKTLANQDPDYAKTLTALADRRGDLEKRGLRSEMVLNASAEEALHLPLRSIEEMVQETLDAQRRRARAAALA
jgi:hypothetical protein